MPFISRLLERFRRRPSQGSGAPGHRLDSAREQGIVASPEQLDKRIVVVGGGYIATLGGLGALLAAVTAWSVYGSIETRVSGLGILLTQDETLTPIEASSPGRVKTVLISPGSRVAAGDVLFLIEQPELSVQLATAHKRLSKRIEEFGDLEKDARELKAKRLEYHKEQIAANRAQIGTTQERLAYLSEELKEREVLLRKGFLTRDAVDRVRAEKSGLETQLSELTANAAQINRAYENFEIEEERRLIRMNEELADLQFEIDRLTVSRDRARKIVSPTDGYIEETLVDDGNFVAPGQRLAQIKTIDVADGFEALLFVGASLGKRIQVGMNAHIIPTTVSPEQYGAMLGEVRLISDRPVSNEQIVKLVGNENLARLYAKEGPPLAVHVDVKEDDETRSGFAWTSGKGPPFSVSAGTLVASRITIESQPPISLVIPYLKKLLDGDEQ